MCEGVCDGCLVCVREREGVCVRERERGCVCVCVSGLELQDVGSSAFEIA